MMLVISRLTK